MTTRSTSRTVNSYRFTSNDKIAQNLTKRKSIIGALQGFGKPEFSLQYLVVGGGGAGGSAGGGGGGGGGVVIGTMGFTDNPIFSGFSATASLYYQRSPGTGHCEMQVTSMGSGYIKPDSIIDVPGVSTNMPVRVVEQRSGTAGGLGNYWVSTVLTAPTCPVAIAQPTASPPAFALTPRTVTGVSGIAYNTPIGVGIGGGGGGASDSRGSLGSASNFGFITAHGGGGGGSGGLPGNVEARGTGSATSIATGGGQGTGVGFFPTSPYGFVAGSVQGGYGGVSWRPAAPSEDVRNGRSGYDRAEDNSFPGFPGPTTTVDNNSHPYALVPGVAGGGGGAAGWDTPSSPDNNSRGGPGGEGERWIYDGKTYGSGGGGSSFQPTNNPSNGGGEEAGWGCVYNGGDEMFDGGTAPSGAPLPPYGSKAGYGGASGDVQAVTAMRNRGGGGGGRFNGASYFGYPPTYRGGVPAPYPGGLGGAALWPTNYANPGSPTFRGRNSGSEGGSGGSGVVIIRYPAVFGNVSNSGSPDVSVTPTGFIHYTFTGSGSITFDYNP